MDSVTGLRLGIVGPYPPRDGGLAARISDLTRALARRFDVVVCAVDRHELTYPDEVVTLVREDEPDDHRRAGRILAEYAVDAVLVHYDGRVIGDRGATGLADLGDELGRRDIPYLVAVHDLADPPAALAALTRGAARTLVYAETVRDRVLALRLTDAGRLSLLDSPTAAGRVARLVRTAVRRHAGSARRAYPVDLVGVPSQPASVEESARLAVLAARLFGLPSGPDPTVWATAALPLLCGDALQTPSVCRDALHNRGWARYGLGALAGEPAVPATLRRRARAGRTALGREGTEDPYCQALAVLGMPGKAGARRLDRALRHAAWPWSADRLDPAAVVVPHALLAAGRAFDDDAMIGHALDALDWYAGAIGLAIADASVRLPTPRERAVDVAAAVEAFAEAYRATGRAHYGRYALRCLDWFDGVPLLDESLLAYLCALLSLAGAGLVELEADAAALVAAA
jgi:hypothetical protein